MTGPLIRVPRARAVRIHQEGTEVILLLDGKVVFRSHWRYAVELADGLRDRAAAAHRFELAASGQPKPQVVSVFGIPLWRKR